MRLSTFRYFGSQAWTSVRRNLSPTAAAVILVSLLTLGAFLGVIRNASTVGADLIVGFQIVAYMEDDLSASAVEDAARRIESIPGVLGRTVRTREVELDRLIDQFPDYRQVVEALGENPLVDAIVVDVEDPERVASVAELVVRIDGVDEVVYGTQAAERLASFARGLKTLSIAGTVFMVVVISLVVGSVVGLTIEYRSAEIEVASLVGATRWFIRWPFVLEAVILAVLLWSAGSALVAVCYVPTVRFFQNVIPFAVFADSWSDVAAICVQMLAIAVISFEVATFIALERMMRSMQKG